MKLIKHHLLFILLILILSSHKSNSQIISTNRNPVGLESNILFNALKRYTVTQTGNAVVDLNVLFDGSFLPTYSTTGITSATPTIITIEGLPRWYHTQAGAWVGWTSRYWPARRFKIEGFDNYYTSGWVTIADYSNTDYDKFDFTISLSGEFTKLRFTFYEGTGDGGRFGISELFFIHPEAATPYAGLFETAGSTWNKSGNDIHFNQGKVGIGIEVPKNTLDVNGTIHAKEVKVDMNNWSDFVFLPSYYLKPLPEVEKFIQANGHLENIPSAAEVDSLGVNLGEMQKKLLQKVEELTLYVIEKDKEIQSLTQIITRQQQMLEELLKNSQTR